MPTLLELFPNPRDFLRLEPEELAGVLLEFIPGILQSGGFNFNGLMALLFSPHGMPGFYPHGAQDEVILSLAEALSWLEVQGLIVRSPGQPAPWYLLSRRGQNIKARIDLEAYAKGRTLPIALLQQSLANKVHHLYLRGDHDIAVLQAFKEVEVATRRIGPPLGEQVGVKLMRAVFHPETGPLRDLTAAGAEREAEMHLFSGAMGHARNPAAHNENPFTGEEAARLIILASHLLEIVHRRLALLPSS